jgi:hypothetical protein
MLKYVREELSVLIPSSKASDFGTMKLICQITHFIEQILKTA